MRILGIETSGDTSSVALLQDGQVLAERVFASRMALSQTLAGHVQAVTEAGVLSDARLDGLTPAGIETHPGTAPDEAAAISVARWGIAETGSVVIHSAPDQPILNAMLPRHWLVAVEETRILPFLDDYAALAKPAPRNAVLITGSSGTTDIEGYFVRGAHGPGFVHVLLISH